MALFHIVPRGIFKSNSNMDCIEHFKLSKMSKNSLRSFLSRENRRDEVRVLSLELQAIFDEHMNQIHARLHNPCFAGLKIVRHSIIIACTAVRGLISSIQCKAMLYIHFGKKVHIAI